MKLMIVSISSVLLTAVLLMEPVFAAKKNRFFPRGCTPDTVGYSMDHLVLGTEKNDRTYRIYVFRNISGSPVVLDYDPLDGTKSNGLESVIQPDMWSAILVDHEKFLLSCKDDYNSYGMTTSCEDTIRACEMAVSPVMESAQGVYWVTENRGSKGSLFRSIRESGIYP